MTAAEVKAALRARHPGGGYGGMPGVGGTIRVLLVGPLPRGRLDRPYVQVQCPECDGLGYLDKSRVEREAPQLWIPRDVGLVVIDASGCHLLRRSPLRKEVPAMNPMQLGQLVRWVSMRPDPRHARVGSAPMDADPLLC